MNEFYFYFKQGVFHILDFQGIDHMLFICLLCAHFKPSEIKKLLIVLTAFTIGHSFSLLFTSLGYRIFAQGTVEFLILLTILATAIFNLVPRLQHHNMYLNYGLATFFGLIHGMGFSNFFQSMMMGMHNHSIVTQVLAFNLGIELGQIIVVSVFMLLYSIYWFMTKGSHTLWRVSFSTLGAICALWWMVA